MKFGKRVLELETPEWRAKFLDYSALKKVLKTKHEPPVANPNEQLPMADMQNPQVAIPFFARLNEELRKVNEFFAEQERSFGEKQGLLNQQIELLRAREDGKYLRRSKMKQLKKIFKEHYRGLSLLLNYRALNFLGFSKILKKFDKVTGNQTSHFTAHNC